MQADEMMGDRCAWLVVTVLIIVTALQMDVGLGNLSYLIWVDYFNLVQLLILLVALAQTMLLHRLMHHKMIDTVVLCDRVFRILIPCLLYPSIALGMVLIGLRHDLGGMLVIIGGTVSTFSLAAWQVYRGKIRADHDRVVAVRAVHNMRHDVGEEEYIRILTTLFNKFDLDANGDIDVREMRILISSLYPNIPRAFLAKGMLAAHQFMGNDEELDLTSFIDAYVEVTATIRKLGADAGMSLEAMTRKPVKRNSSDSVDQTFLAQAVRKHANRLGGKKSFGNTAMALMIKAAETSPIDATAANTDAADAAGAAPAAGLSGMLERARKTAVAAPPAAAAETPVMKANPPTELAAYEVQVMPSATPAAEEQVLPKSGRRRHRSSMAKTMAKTESDMATTMDTEAAMVASCSNC